MNRIALVVLVWLSAWPALGDEDKPSPRQQYDALVQESRQARQDYLKTYRQAKADEERRKAVMENVDKLTRIAGRLLSLAEKNPQDPVAFDALNHILTLNISALVQAKAAALLLRDYVESDKIGPACRFLQLRFEGDSETLLRTVLAKNTHRDVKSAAALALAQFLSNRARLVKQMKDDPQMAQRIERLAGKDIVEELKKADGDKLASASAAAYRECADKFAADMPVERLQLFCIEIRNRGEKASEEFLRTLMGKDARREVRGVACLTLALNLKSQAEALDEKNAKESAKLRREIEELLVQAAEKYGDVKRHPRQDTVGEKANSELHELRHLSVGMKAPEIDGEDQDGKKFKLGDYKGKIVLLDFWSRY